MANSNKLNTIQFLRAIAVLLVVHCHAIDFWNNSKQTHFFYLENFGAVGVDIFFVISGFVITIISYQYAKEKGGFYFFLKRIVRVVPVYWLFSFFVVVIDYLHSGNLHDKNSILKTILFIPFPSDYPIIVSPILSQGWTLSFELVFYSVVSMAMLAGAKRYLQITVLFFLALVCINVFTKNQYVYINFAGSGIMLEFLMGVLTGAVFLSGFYFSKTVSVIIFMTGIAGLLATLFFGFGSISQARFTLNGHLAVYRSILWGLPSAMLVAGFVMREKAGPVKIQPVWIGIGNASYSIYLTHNFFLQSIYLRFTKWDTQKKVPPDVQLLIAMAIVVAGGYIFYRLLEKPLLGWLGKYVRKGIGRRASPGIPGQI